jgi:hypothetical protein
MDKNKELKKEYIQNGTEAGVYIVKCSETNRILIGSSTNAQGVLNRHKFELKMKMHRNRVLQDDWNQYGEGAFTFTVADTLKKKEDPSVELKQELLELENLWRANLLRDHPEVYRD